MNAFKRIRSGVETKTYYVRFELKGKAYLRKTPYTNSEQALAFGRALRASLEKQDCAALKIALDQSSYRRTMPFATIGQVMDAYLKNVGPVQQITNPTTIQGNIYALRNIILRAHLLPDADRLDTRTLTADQLHQVRALASSVLNAELIRKFKTNAFHRAQKQTPQQAEATYRSANSILIQARGIFTKPLLESYRSAGLHLPDLKDFTTKPLFNKVAKDEYNPASDALIAKTFAALDELERHDLDAYLAIWLAIGFGLRRAEICVCRPEWFVPHNNTPHLHFQHRSKDRSLEFTLGCQLDAWQHLAPHVQLALAAQKTYLLGQDGRPLDRHSDVWRRLSIWMRDLGWQTQKTLHEFRAWSGCQIAMAHGLLAAKIFLRHKTITTTERYYGRYINLQIAHVPLQLPVITEPTIAIAAVNL